MADLREGRAARRRVALTTPGGEKMGSGCCQSPEPSTFSGCMSRCHRKPALRSWPALRTAAASRLTHRAQRCQRTLASRKSVGEDFNPDIRDKAFFERSAEENGIMRPFRCGIADDESRYRHSRLHRQLFCSRLAGTYRWTHLQPRRTTGRTKATGQWQVLWRAAHRRKARTPLGNAA